MCGERKNYKYQVGTANCKKNKSSFTGDTIVASDWIDYSPLIDWSKYHIQWILFISNHSQKLILELYSAHRNASQW